MHTDKLKQDLALQTRARWLDEHEFIAIRTVKVENAAPAKAQQVAKPPKGANEQQLKMALEAVKQRTRN
jgi:hypothetical protein